MTDAPASAPGVRLRGRAPGRFADIDISFAGGCWTAILGRSGVGKSSVLSAVAGALETFQGSRSAEDGDDLDGRIAYMTQDAALPPWLDIAGAVALGDRLRGRRADGDRVEAALAAVGLGGLAHRRADALSGGQRQRAALARTLYEDRPVVLLDEPFSALDALTRHEVQDLAAAKLADRTVALVTHDPLEAARLAHRVIVLGPDGVDALSLDGAPPRPPYADMTRDQAARLHAALAAAEAREP